MEELCTSLRKWLLEVDAETMVVTKKGVSKSKLSTYKKL